MNILDKYPLDRYEQLCEFLRRNYREDHPLCSEEYFKWQFRVNNNKATLLSAWNDEILIGIIGYVPFPLFWGDVDHPFIAAWSINWMVEREQRTGVGWVLMRRLQELFPVVFGTGVTPDNKKLIGPMGWKFFEKIPRYLCVFDLEKAERCKKKNVESSEIEKFKYVEEKGTDLIESEKNNYAPDWSLYPHLKFGTVRSWEYLKWRYMDHPVFDYKLFVYGEKHRVSLCVLRIEESFGEFNERVARITEFFHPDDGPGRKDGILLLNGVLSWLKKKGCVYTDFVCSSGYYGQSVEEAGFRRETFQQVLPARISPVEKKPYDYTLELWSKENMRNPVSLENIYMTKADGDEDRPVTFNQGTKETPACQSH